MNAMGVEPIYPVWVAPAASSMGLTLAARFHHNHEQNAYMPSSSTAQLRLHHELVCGDELKVAECTRIKAYVHNCIPSCKRGSPSSSSRASLYTQVLALGPEAGRLSC
jgi:hypothetical protein